ncbi:MAG: hypothetical protein HGA96_17275 [Desulfobulbaceae bacterium]|nr:hypothetical protein [Desulfobulbaceae bacterium]
MERVANGKDTAELRKEAVRLVVEEGMSVERAALHLSLPKSTLTLGLWPRNP